MLFPLSFTPHVPIFVSVYDTREHSMCVCAGADEEENHEKEGLEVEKRGLRCVQRPADFRSSSFHAHHFGTSELAIRNFRASLEV